MKKLFYTVVVFTGLIFCTASFTNAQSGGVAVNAVGSPPDTSALFDVSSTTKGELMPRMTTAQRNAIVNPAMGLTVFNTDCRVYNFNAGTPSAPVWATLNSSNALVAGVSIAANPAGAVCAGTSVMFTATPSSGINSPNYQWQVNGSNAGSNSSTLTSTSLNNGDVVTCILSTGEACVTGSPATSNSINMTVNPVPSTPGSISGSTNLCTNSSGNVFVVSPVSGATTYTWTVPDDATITAGAGTNSITVTFGSTSANISVTAGNSCGTSSASIQAITINPPAPGTPGSISGSTSGVGSSSGNLYFISPVSNATTYTWSVPAGASITSGQGMDSILVTFGTNSGNISVTAGNSCGTSSANSIVVSVCVYSPGSQTFNYTGGQQTYTVPSCVFTVNITAYGAQGIVGSSSGFTTTGGMGGEATGALTVTPGQILHIFVGGYNVGWNGGGVGGIGYGGDASDVRVGGTALSNRVIVAGGGGGACYRNGNGNGGNGGGTNGVAGTNSTLSGGYGGGGGGSQSVGGSAGSVGGNSGDWDGLQGSLGQGASCSGGSSGAGGAGGGGYYGGGSGGSTNGSNSGGYYAGGGGGGSSYVGGVSGGATNPGVQSGNGQVAFTW